MLRASSSSLRGRTLDALIVGGGHNGLVAAAYLSRAGKKVAVLERRHVLGGAAVTEEIVPGFKFSRASYLLSLLRPRIIRDLELKRHGLKMYLRDPNSFTPVISSDKSLLLGNNMRENQQQIAQFSAKDAQMYPQYEHWIEKIASALDPLLDSGPVNIATLLSGSVKERFSALGDVAALAKMAACLGRDLPTFYELVTAPAAKILEKWFESEPLKATLATDAVIGAMASPRSPGSGYVLLHHVMGELEGRQNVWAYAEGGMGAVSAAIARAAESHGAVLCTESPVAQFLLSGSGTVEGVTLEDGTELRSKVTLSSATPKITFLDLLPKGSLPAAFEREVRSIDYTSPVTKINVALRGLPNFLASPSPPGGLPAPHHQCTIHLNTENIETVHQAFLDAERGRYSAKPMMELTFPSSLDPTLAPPGSHVASIFSQYTPYRLAEGEWNEERREAYASTVFDSIEAYAPGFRSLVVGYEVLTPPDLESIFGLTGGNIFHGAMSVDQLYFTRPTPLNPSYRTPVPGLFLCGSGAHPGGGVMGSPGRLAALTALEQL